MRAIGAPCANFVKPSDDWQYWIVPGFSPALYCLSYSPLPNRLKTLNPAFFASETESAFGELKVDQTFRTGFLHAGQFVSGLAETGRRSVNLPPHTGQPPSQSSYSYNGIAKNPKFEFRKPKGFQNANS